MKPIDRNIYNHLEKFTPQKRTEVIMEVQYHIQELYGQVIVIKYGGAALTEEKVPTISINGYSNVKMGWCKTSDCTWRRS